MPHSNGWLRDRQLQLIVAIWALVLIDAVRQGLTLPASELAARWQPQPSQALLAFTVLAPPLLVAANHFFPMRGGWADWPKRLVDRRFGEGAAERFWVRLRPLSLMSLGAFVLGGTGYVASDRIGSASGSSMSILFVGFGIGFLVGALLDGYIFRKPNAA
jgi:hypothetical protein